MTEAKHTEPLSFDLPGKLKFAIATSITLFSRLDTCILECIWADQQPDIERKKKLAKGHAAGNIKAVQDVVARATNDMEFDAIWKTLSDLLAQRNLIAHGAWMVDGNGIPVVVWHSKMLENDDEVGGELFPYEKFDHFLKRASIMLNTFSEFKRMIDDVAKNPDSVYRR